MVRRLSGTTDLLLLVTVGIWALNVSVTRYVLTHGFLPLVYGSIRYAAAAVLAAGFVLALERTLRVYGRRAWLLILTAALILWANQLCFVYSLDLASATTVALIMGTTPVFAALIASGVGLERLSSRAWIATLVSFGGVALVALGSGGRLSADLGGELLAVGLSATWAAYSVCLAPLMRTYSPYRISGLVMLPMTALLLLTSIGSLGDQNFGNVSGLDWAALAYAIVGPLVLTNVLWFTAIRRVGPSRATLFANLQPFVAVLIAVVLLSEGLSVLQVLGGVCIAIGIGIGRVRVRGREPASTPTPAPAE
jgi:drug/metabolite transporter (DMT)-like permease